MVEIFEIFSTSFQTNVLQDPMISVQKYEVFFQNLVLVLEMAISEHCW